MPKKISAPNVAYQQLLRKVFGTLKYSVSLVGNVLNFKNSNVRVVIISGIIADWN